MKKKTSKKNNLKKKLFKSPSNEITKQLELLDLEKKRMIADREEQEKANKQKESVKQENIIPVNEKLLTDDFETQFSTNEPIRELFTPKNIKFKTELSEEQRGAVAILYQTYMQCVNYGIDFSGLKDVLDEYIDFGVSVDRKGRTEYVEAHKSAMQMAQAQALSMQNGMTGQMGQMKMN